MPAAHAPVAWSLLPSLSMLNLRARSRSWYEAVRSSYWFVPSLMALTAVAMSFAMIFVDQRFGADWLGDGVWRYTGSADGARTLLGAIASSMVGLAGVVFSINIVALTLASGQFGSRLLRNFMSDQGNQVTLGTFVAGFLYCLLILRTIHGSNDSGREAFLPQFSILVAVLLALAGLAVLIFFIHHAAESIQAPNVISSVFRDLRHAVEHNFPDPLEEQAAEPTGAPLPDDFEDRSVAVEAGEGGYLQRIEIDQLVEQAAEHDLVLRVEHRPGQYVQGDSPVVRAWPTSRMDGHRAGRIRATFTVGTQRSLAQDAGYAIEQLVEVAVRALSPESTIRSPPCSAWIVWARGSRSWPGASSHAGSCATKKARCASSGPGNPSPASWTWPSTRSGSTGTPPWTCSCA